MKREREDETAPLVATPPPLTELVARVRSLLERPDIDTFEVLDVHEIITPQGFTYQTRAALRRQTSLITVETPAECAVCLAVMRAPQRARVLRCTHAFHMACIDPWLQAHANPRCPLCREIAVVTE